MSSIEAILTASQLRWTGHVTRMSSDRLPKAVFYGELSSGKRLRGGGMEGGREGILNICYPSLQKTCFKRKKKKIGAYVHDL